MSKLKNVLVEKEPEQRPNIGGFFAPAMTSEKISKYESLLDDSDVPGDVREAMEKLLNLATIRQAGNQTGGSPLHPEEIRKLDVHIPWDWEIDAYRKLFDEIRVETSKALRDAAFHLLWWAEMLSKGIEPTTQDKI